MNTVNELHDTNRTTISLSKENYEKLKRLGSFGDSFDSILSRVLEQVNKK